MKAKHVHKYRDLEEYGIIPLTGESCTLSLRYLFDLTPEGVKSVESFFGNNITIQRGSNWNSKGVASILLGRNTVRDLIVFVLYERWAHVVEFQDEHFAGMDDETYQAYRKSEEEFKNLQGLEYKEMIVRHWHNEGKGTRNVHAMTGRVV